jgi:hypothetical protein
MAGKQAKSTSAAKRPARMDENMGDLLPGLAIHRLSLDATNMSRS